MQSTHTKRPHRAVVATPAGCLLLALALLPLPAVADGGTDPFQASPGWIEERTRQDGPWFSLELGVGLAAMEETHVTGGGMMLGLDLSLSGTLHFTRVFGLTFRLGVQYGDVGVSDVNLAPSDLANPGPFHGTYARSDVSATLGFQITPWSSELIAVSVTPMAGVAWQENRLIGATAWAGTEFVAGGRLALYVYPVTSLEVGVYLRGLAHLGGDNDHPEPWRQGGLPAEVRASLGAGALIGWHF